MAPTDPADVTVITGYLTGARRAAREAQAALHGGDLDTALGHINSLVYDARQAQARAEQVLMLAEEAARAAGSGDVTPWATEHVQGDADAAAIEAAERMAEQDR